MKNDEVFPGVHRFLRISQAGYGCRFHPWCDQRGQATVFVLAFLGIILLSMVFLFKSGRLTTEKMQLQNGADSAAYTASMLEARAMNFAAYTNRAMVANEVAIGQMVGLLSWADEITAIGETLEVVGGVLDATVVLAEAGAALNAVGGGFIEAGETMTKALLAVAPLATRGISMVNMVYSASQEIYHLTTILLVTNAIFQSLEDNVPGTPGDYFIKRLFTPGEKGARLSPLGLIALAGHIPSYINEFSKRYALKDSGSSKEALAGMGRLAATVREGRDPFSSGDTTPKDGISQDRGWALEGRATAGVKIPPVFTLTGTFTFGMESAGGSEIRYKDNTYIWSGVDAASWEDAIDLTYKAPIGRAHHKHIRLPSLPLAGGAYQANGGKQSLSLADMPVTLRQYGSPPAYGRAADHTAGWIEAGVRIGENTVPGNPYPNLHSYRDIDPDNKDGRTFLPFTSPFFLIGVIRPMKDIEGQGPQFAAPFDLPHAAEIDGSLGAIAKAEVYHRRPDDLSYFQRKDGKTEKDTLFSPFWQAHLVKTSDLDRFLSLVLQQKIIWLSHQDAAEVPGAEKVIDLLRKLLGKLL